MRIAICYYGLSYNLEKILGSNAYNFGVNYEKAFPSHRDNLIGPNDPVDIFIHSWSHSKIGDIIDKYQPKKSLFEQQIDFTEEANQINNNPNIFGFEQRHHILSRWYSTQKVLELKQQYEKENNFEYDLVMLTRFDCFYSGDWNLVQLNPEYFYVVGGWGGNYNTELPDLWFISNSKDIDKLSNVNKGIKDIFKEESDAIWGGHYLIKKYLDKINITSKIKHYKTHHIDNDILRG